MALINTVSPQQAEGQMKEAYDMFMERLGVIPKPLQMMSASPGIFAQQLQKIHYYNDHPTLGHPLLTHIRYLVSLNLDYKFCTDFSKHILKLQGLEETDIRQMETDPGKSAYRRTLSFGKCLAALIHALIRLCAPCCDTIPPWASPSPDAEHSLPVPVCPPSATSESA